MISAGSLHSIRLYPHALTNYDVQALASVPSRPLHFAPQCRCPPSHSAIRSVTSQDCFSLDDSSSVQRLTSNSRDIGYINDADTSTVWVSRVGQSQVNITMDLNGMREVLFFQMTFQSLRPRAMVVEKSADGGGTWRALQYYARDCATSFGLADNAVLLSSTDVQCSTLYSSASPGFVSFSLLNPAIRPNSTLFDRDVGLQQFAQATHLRARLVESNVPVSCASELFYAANEWLVTGRQCVCNGHASQCTDAVCACQHNTAGTSCQQCLPLYNDRPWQAGTVTQANECRMCSCNNHSQSCVYNSVAGRGVCQSCADFTQGPSCELCVSRYYHPTGVSLASPSACVPCACTVAGVTDSGDCRRGDLVNGDSGQCTCKTRVSGRQCDRCLAGFFNLSTSYPNGCQPCSCNTTGTVAGNVSCHKTTGQCQCKADVLGLQCDRCRTGFYDISHSAGCQPCHPQCSSAGCVGAGPSSCLVSHCQVLNIYVLIHFYQ